MGNFYADTIVPDPRFRSTERISDPFLLEPVTRQKVAAIIAGAAAQGIELEIFETYRSQERQGALFAQGATKLQSVGVHHYGLACDLVKIIEGKPSWGGDFSFLGPLAAQQSMVWGGDWGQPGVKHGFMDEDHVQRIAVSDQNALFEGWYPFESYSPT